jgi:hypothetical protein
MRRKRRKRIRVAKCRRWLERKNKTALLHVFIPSLFRIMSLQKKN